MKLYCEDNGKPLRQRSWSTLACLVDGNLGDYWQDGSEMGTEEVISNSSRIDQIEVVKQVTTLPWHFTPKGALFGPIYGIYVG